MVIVACVALAAPAVGGAATFTVTTSADSGPGSLREAITQSNAGVPIGSRNLIAFNIPAPVAPIAPATDLPPITEPVLIDGLTQPGAQANTDPSGFNAVLPIRVTGTTGTGLQVGTGLNNGLVTISGLSVEGFATGIDSNSTRLQLEVVGSRISGSATDRAGRVGVVLRRTGGFDVVGGPAIAETTLVTDEATGVRLLPGSDPNATGSPRVDGSIVRDNDVGVELATFASVEETIVGTLDPSDAGKQDIGVLVNARGAVANSTISGNRVGVDIRAEGVTIGAGNFVSDNLAHGIVVSTGPGGAFISPGAGVDPNVIVDNGGAGVAVLSGTGTVIDRTAIDGNGGLGIDLGGDGHTPNDPFDVDDLDPFGSVLPNRLQNSPVVLDASTANGATTVSGRFHGTSGIQVRWELFAGTSCDPSGYGEGALPLERGVATTDAAGNASVSGVGPSVPDGTVFTATVTTADGTSEFSPCATSHPAPAMPTGPAPPVSTPPPPTSSEGSRAPADTTAPRITALRVVPSTFAVAATPTPKAASAARGTSIRFRLSEAAQVALGFHRLVEGRRVAGKCRRVTRTNRSAKRCTRALSVGAINRPGTAGANRVAFSGRIGARALIRGSYRLTIRAVDSAGNAARPQTTTFIVVRTGTGS